MEQEQVKFTNKINPFQLLDNDFKDEKWEKELIYRSIQGHLQGKELSDMGLRVYNKEPEMPYDKELKQFLSTGNFKEEIGHPSIFQYAKQHYGEESVSMSNNVKYEAILKSCKRKKHIFWKKYSSIPPKTNELQKTREQVNDVVRVHKIPTMAGFVGVSLAITYFMKLNLNPMSYRFAALLTGVGIGYLYSDFKNSDKIFCELPELEDTQANLEKWDIINYCFSVDPELMGKALLQREEI